MLGTTLKPPSSVGYNSTEGMADLQTPRNNESCSEALAGNSTSRLYGSVYSKGGITPSYYAF
jgi:hypothetical protein